MVAKLVPKEYVYEWERKAFPYYLYIFSKAWFPGQFSLPVNTVFLLENGTAQCYLHKGMLRQAGLGIVKVVETGNDFLRRWGQYVYRSGRDIDRFCARLQRVNFKHMSDNRLFKLYQEAFQIYDACDYHIVIIRNSNGIVQQRLQKIFEPSVVATLLSTGKKSFFIKEHEELLKISQRITRNKISPRLQREMIEAHAKKFFYLTCGYYLEKPLSVEDFEKKLRLAMQEGETLSSFRRELKKLAVQRGQLLRRLKLTKKIDRLVEFGSESTYFKDYIRSKLNHLLFYNVQIFKEIARRTNNNWQVVASVLPNEIEEVIKYHKKIKERHHFVLFSDGEKINSVDGIAAKQLVAKFNKHFLPTAASKLVGTGASSGKVRGTVLIVHDVKEAAGKRGYILVAPMTTPDLMPAMRKAIAIITDEGGLTSHAAIVSRELGIPCVVGTKVATKVLRNGDTVEVDAARGLIKKLLARP